MAEAEDNPIHVLLVEDDPDYAQLVKVTLSRSQSAAFEVHHFERLDDALGRMEDEKYDVMLLDLSLPDGYGAFTVGCACSLARHLPVLVLTATEDNELARKAVQAGAQDYLVKQQVDRKALPELILRAIERYAHTDRLLTLGEQQAERGSARTADESASQDSETGLAGELVFYNHVLSAIEKADQQPYPVGIMALRFGEFSVVANRYGQEAAIELLRDAATRVKAITRPDDTVARIGPDSIGIVLAGSRSREEVEELAAAALTAVAHAQMSTGDGAGVEGLPTAIGISLHPTGRPLHGDATGERDSRAGADPATRGLGLRLFQRIDAAKERLSQLRVDWFGVDPQRDIPADTPGAQRTMWCDLHQS